MAVKTIGAGAPQLNAVLADRSWRMRVRDVDELKDLQREYVELVRSMEKKSPNSSHSSSHCSS
jgi:hypothetical protein